MLERSYQSKLSWHYDENGNKHIAIFILDLILNYLNLLFDLIFIINYHYYYVLSKSV